jgi:hypothetical protein
MDQVQTVLPLETLAAPQPPLAPSAPLPAGLEQAPCPDTSRQYVPPGAGQAAVRRRPRALSALALFVIVLASFVLQAQVVRLPAGLTQSVLLLLSVVLEFGLISIVSIGA